MIRVDQKVVDAWSYSETRWAYHSAALATTGPDLEIALRRTKPTITITIPKEFSV